MKKIILGLSACMLVVIFSMSMANIASSSGVDLCKYFKYPDNLAVFGVEISALDTSKLVKTSSCDGVDYYEFVCDRGIFHDQGKNEDGPKDSQLFWGFVTDKDGKLRAYSRLLTFKASAKVLEETFQKMKQNLGDEPKVSASQKGKEYSWKTAELTTKLKVGKTDEEGRVYLEVNQYYEPLRPEGHK